MAHVFKGSKLQRRQLLKAIGASAVIPNHPLLAYTQRLDDINAFPEGIMQAPLTGNSGTLQVLQGQLPADLYGHCFVAEGIPLEAGHLSPGGRGALTRYDFGHPEGVRFTRSMIDTPSAILQQHVSGWLDRFRLLGGMLYFSPRLGFMNYCNTVPMPIGDGRFLLGYEGGIPYEFDPHSLALITPVGHFNEWESSLPSFANAFTPDRWFFQQVRTTAHPYWDQDSDQVFTINYGGNVGESGLSNAHLHLLMWDKQGPFNRWNVLTRDGKPAYISSTTHTFGVTREHILIFNTAARVEALRMIGIDSITPQTHSTPIWIIRRSDLLDHQDHVIADYVELNFDTSDVVCDYDDRNGEITLYGQYLGATDKSEPLYEGESCHFGGKVPKAHAGYPVSPVDVGGVVRARIRVTESSASEIKEDFTLVRDPLLCWDMNDPAHRHQFQNPERLRHLYWSATGYRPDMVVERMVEAYQDYPNRYFDQSSMPESVQPSSLIHLDCENMLLSDAYQFPGDAICRSPQFMPRPGSTAQDDGYLLAWVVRQQPTANQGTGKELWIFDARALQQGPLCVLGSSELQFATTNHALWVESLGQRAVDAYRVDVSDHFRSKLHRHSREVRNVVERDVLPRFS